MLHTYQEISLIQPQQSAPVLREPANTPEDHILIGAIDAGDDQALELLYGRYADVIYRLVSRIVKDHMLAEEVVQEVFVRVWRRSSSFNRERGRVAQWLFGIAYHLCIDELRRLRARPLPIYEEQAARTVQEIIDEHNDVADTAWALERQRGIVDALNRLPEPQRRAIILSFWGEMSHQEIAIALDSPLGTIKTRVRLGLEKLGALLATQGLQPGDV